MLIRIWKLQYVSLLSLLLLAGCGSQTVDGPVRVSPAAAAAPQAAPATGSARAALPPTSGGFSLPIGADIPPETPDFASNPAGTGQQPSPSQPSQEIPTATPAPTSAPFIHLSAGVAVPQNLPTGTVMAISVDCEVYAELKTSFRYALVVKSGAGEIVSEIKPQSSGNLSVFFPQLKPEHRPFTARIEEVTPGSKRRTIVSNEVTLKTDY